MHAINYLHAPFNSLEPSIFMEKYFAIYEQAVMFVSPREERLWPRTASHTTYI